MKRIIVTFVLVNIILTKCHVTSSTKNTDLTTSLPLNNQAQNISDIKSVEKKKNSTKEFNLNDSVYLDDVIFALKNQNWTEEEKPCLQATLLLLNSLQNYTLWAVWNWDSISSEPQGLLFGSRFQLGNFDECMNAPWYDKQPELRTQYCLANIVLERTDKRVKTRIDSDYFHPYQSALNVLEYKSKFLRPLNELTWGVCVPAVCQPKSVERLMGILLAHSHLGTAGLHARISVDDACQKAEKSIPFDILFYAFICVMGSLTILTLLCTFIKYNRKESNEDQLQNEIITAFDIQSNAKNLLKTSSEGLEVLYGVKFLSMCIIVSGHQFGIFNGGPVSNGSKVDEDALSILGMMVLHDDIVVDSFFMLSGFLTSIVLIKIKNIPNIFLLFFKRYIRLVVAYAIMVFYICAVYPYTGSGPLWQRAIAEDTEKCRKNWWLSFLMLSNYIDTENICLLISWYIPCDFHFFVVTVTLYWLYKKCPSVGKVLAILVSVAAILSPGIINYIYNLPAIQLFTYEFISNPRGPRQFHMTYIKSHTRYAAYLIGFFTGYLYIYCATSDNLKKIPQKWSILGAFLSILTMIVVMFTGPTFIWRNYDPVESAIYAALNRPVWASCLAILVICCSLGHVPLIKGFLSWSPWVPLSRLSYGLYLVHPVIISRNVYVTRNPQHYDIFNILTSILGIICEGCVAALLIWLIAEAPINNLLTLCFKSKITTIMSVRNTSEGTSTNDGNYKGNNNRHNNYLQDNMPTSVQIISSKI